MKKCILVFALACCVVLAFAQNNDTNKKPWEEIIFKTETGIIPDTAREYTIEVRFSPYGNEAFITYIILENLFYESDAVYAIRDVARRLTAEYGYDWYSYSSDPVLRYDYTKHTANYRADVIFRKYIIQKEP